MMPFTLVHRPKPDRFAELPASWRVWQTCLRSIALSWNGGEPGFAKPSDEVLQGRDAYLFLLNVVCGLHSPVVGETEVFGQFRQFADTALKDKASFVQGFFSDVKAVRQTHLRHLGSQSYGSWVRRRLTKSSPGPCSVNIVGTGQLAQEVYHWLKKESLEIRFFSRDPQAARLRLYEALKWEEPSAHAVGALHELPPATDASVATVIASPVDRADLAIEKAGLVIDLREQAAEDRIEAAGELVTLQDIFSEIESNRSVAERKVRDAKEMILSIVNERYQSQTIRPFGWDDLCA